MAHWSRDISQTKLPNTNIWQTYVLRYGLINPYFHVSYITNSIPDIGSINNSLNRFEILKSLSNLYSYMMVVDFPNVAKSAVVVDPLRVQPNLVRKSYVI